MQTTQKLKVIRACLNGLAAAGYDVEESTDYLASVDRLRPLGKVLTPMLSPDENDFAQGNCFWMLLLHEGRVVGGIAARLDVLGDETLGRFWRRQARRVYGGGAVNQLRDVSRFIDREVSGNIVYFGDLVLDTAHRGRGSHLRYFTMYCQMLASVMWRPDWQYSFMPAVHAHSGLAYNHGFSKVITGAQEWVDPPRGRKTSEVCGINSRVDIADMAAYFSRFPKQLGIIKDQA